MSNWKDITDSLSPTAKLELQKYADYNTNNRKLLTALQRYPQLKRRYKPIVNCSNVLSGKQVYSLAPVSYCRLPNACHLCNYLRSHQYADQFAESAKIFADKYLRSSQLKIVPFVVQFPYAHGTYHAAVDLPETGERIQRFIEAFAVRRHRSLQCLLKRQGSPSGWREKLIGATAIDVHVVPSAKTNHYDRYAKREVSRSLPPRLHVHLLVSVFKRATKRSIRKVIEHSLLDAYAGTGSDLTATCIEGDEASLVRMGRETHWRARDGDDSQVIASSIYGAKHVKRDWSPQAAAETIAVLNTAGLKRTHTLLGKYVARPALPSSFDPIKLNHRFLARTHPKLVVFERK